MSIADEFKNRVGYKYDISRNLHTYRCRKGFFSISDCRQLKALTAAAVEFKECWSSGEYAEESDRDEIINDFLTIFLDGDEE